MESTVNRSTQNGQIMRLLFSVSVPISCIVMLLNFSPRPITPFDPIFKEMDYNVVTNQCVYDLKTFNTHVKLNALESKMVRYITSRYASILPVSLVTRMSDEI